MAFNKIGENLSFSPETDLMTSKQALSDEQVAKRFVKLAKKLKRIAPKANDFLYGHAIMMHAAEASLIDQETGKPVMGVSGKPAKGSFKKIKIKGNQDSVKWESPDNIMPYKNANGDIFPEEELLKAYKKWIGKPLCKDHKSDSVDGIRGIIIDTHYDPVFKRVHALFALDKKNYPDLARKVETGYANCVSMGTAVGRSVCTECGHVARTERDYCHHVRARANYGEVNLDLNPIELSLVVNGADGLAKIRNIVASLQSYAQKKQDRIDELLVGACVNPTELQALSDNVNELQTKLSALMKLEQRVTPESEEKVAEADLRLDEEEMDVRSLVGLLRTIDDPALKSRIEQILKQKFGVEDTQDEAPRAMPATGGGSEPSVSPMAGGGDGTYRTTTTPISVEPSQRFAGKEGDDNLGALHKEMRLLRSKIDKLSKSYNELKKVSKEDTNMNSARLRARAKARRAYWHGGGGINEPTPGKPKYEKEDYQSIRDEEDKQMVGEPLETGSEGLHPGDKEKKEKYLRAEELAERKMKREALIEQAKKDAESGGKLSEAELKKRRMKRRAWWQGGGGINHPDALPYPKEDAESVRNNEDKQLAEVKDLGGTEGMVPGDKEVKEKYLRAKLRAKFTKVADDQGNIVKDASRWDVFAGDKLILTATGSEIYGDQLGDNWGYLSSKEYGKDVIRHIRQDGFDRVAYLLKGAEDPLAPAPGGEDLLAPDAGGAAPAPEAPAPEPKAEEDDDVKGKVESNLAKIEGALEEIRQAVSEGGEKLVDIEVKVDEGKEKAAPSPMEQTLASFREKALEVSALLDESADELALVSEALEKNNSSELIKAASQALEDSEAVLAEAEVVLAKKHDKKDKEEDKKDKEEKEDKKEKDEDKEEKEDKKEKSESEKKAEQMLQNALKLRAENRAALLAKAMSGDVDMGYDMEAEDEGMDMGYDMGDDDMAMDLSDEDKGKLMKKLLDSADDMAKDKDDDEDEDEDDKDEKKDKKDEDEEDDAMYVDDKGVMHAHGPKEDHNDDCMPADTEVSESLNSVMAARKAERDSLIAQAEGILGKYELDLGPATNATEPKYFEAHPGGKGTTTELTHTKTDGAHVESLSETHDKMLDVATSGPRNVREAAALIQEQIVKGAMNAEDLDKLVAEGKVDSEAAAYWKKYFGMAPDDDGFGEKLVKDYQEKKKEAGNTNYKAKLRRAYTVGLQAQEKGLIASTQGALDEYVDHLMNFDDAAFESNKRVVAKYNTSKKGGSLPRVGSDAENQPITVNAGLEEPAPQVSLNQQLSMLDWK